MKNSKRKAISILTVACTGILGVLVATGGADPKSSKKDPALERTRKQVRMLDDIYKSAIVLVTENYVTETTDLPAGSAFKAWFAAVKKKGWHEVRLLDATGEPYNDENTPMKGFEQEAVKQLKQGKLYVDKVVERNGKRYLLAATPIPVVMKKCVMCHDNYADVPAGKPIGALGYTVPIE